jgi:hypothetical protein
MGEMAKECTTIEAGGHEVRLSSPSKIFFPQAGHTKLDLAEYYVQVADAAVIHLRERPTTLKRFVDGADGDFFFQKRVPKGAPDWLQTATVHFPSGRSANELVRAGEEHLRDCGARRITALVGAEDEGTLALWRAADYGHDRQVSRFVRNL